MRSPSLQPPFRWVPYYGFQALKDGKGVTLSIIGLWKPGAGYLVVLLDGTRGFCVSTHCAAKRAAEQHYNIGSNNVEDLCTPTTLSEDWLLEPLSSLASSVGSLPESET